MLLQYEFLRKYCISLFAYGRSVVVSTVAKSDFYHLESNPIIDMLKENIV